MTLDYRARRWLKRLALALLAAALALAAAAWWTTWLDPHLPALASWRQLARQSAVVQAFAPASPPQWRRVPPGDGASCLRQAGGTLNEAYMACRNGRDELVRANPDGSRTVLEVRPLPPPDKPD